LRAAI
jgi:hypothetical protein